jgi:phosphate-selective porin OprO/OprP
MQVDYRLDLAPGRLRSHSRAYYVTSAGSQRQYYSTGTAMAHSASAPKNNLVGARDGWGLWEANLRYSAFDGTDFNSSNPAFTGRLGTSASFPNITQGTNKAHAYTLGLKWLPNHYTRFMLNLIRTEFDTPVTVNGRNTDYENAITFRTQVDF